MDKRQRKQPTEEEVEDLLHSNDEEEEESLLQYKGTPPTEEELMAQDAELDYEEEGEEYEEELESPEKGDSKFSGDKVFELFGSDAPKREEGGGEVPLSPTSTLSKQEESDEDMEEEPAPGAEGGDDGFESGEAKAPEEEPEPEPEPEPAPTPKKASPPKEKVPSKKEVKMASKDSVKKPEAPSKGSSKERSRKESPSREPSKKDPEKEERKRDSSEKKASSPPKEKKVKKKVSDSTESSSSSSSDSSSSESDDSSRKRRRKKKKKQQKAAELERRAAELDKIARLNEDTRRLHEETKGMLARLGLGASTKDIKPPPPERMEEAEVEIVAGPSRRDSRSRSRSRDRKKGSRRRREESRDSKKSKDSYRSRGSHHSRESRHSRDSRRSPEVARERSHSSVGSTGSRKRAQRSPFEEASEPPKRDKRTFKEVLKAPPPPRPPAPSPPSSPPPPEEFSNWKRKPFLNDWIKKFEPTAMWEFLWREDGPAGFLEYLLYKAWHHQKGFKRGGARSRDSAEENLGPNWPPLTLPGCENPIPHGVVPKIKDVVDRVAAFDACWPIIQFVQKLVHDAREQRWFEAATAYFQSSGRQMEKGKFFNVYDNLLVARVADHARRFFSEKDNQGKYLFAPIPTNEWRALEAASPRQREKSLKLWVDGNAQAKKDYDSAQRNLQLVFVKDREPENLRRKLEAKEGPGPSGSQSGGRGMSAGVAASKRLPSDTPPPAVGAVAAAAMRIDRAQFEAALSVGKEAAKKAAVAGAQAVARLPLAQQVQDPTVRKPTKPAQPRSESRQRVRLNLKHLDILYSRVPTERDPDMFRCETNEHRLGFDQERLNLASASGRRITLQRILDGSGKLIGCSVAPYDPNLDCYRDPAEMMSAMEPADATGGGLAEGMEKMD